MDVIELFVVLCTVVLLCSWAFMIYSNWKSQRNMIQFPPYGYDECPIGYRLDITDNTKCTPKLHTKEIRKDSMDSVSVNPAANDKMTSNNVCAFYNAYKENSTLAWDGLPTKSTYKDPEASKARQILDGCCADGTNTCSSLDFSRLIGKSDLD